ncbi:MAG: glycosyltransferase family 2 protein [Acidimicrobiales bacterium]
MSEGVAAVVVNYNAGSHLPGCIASLERAEVSEIVVVDNASSDTSAVAVAGTRARWLAAGANLGYGRAANLGAAATTAPYLLVCNPDVELLDGAVDALVRALGADATVALVGPALRNPDGTIYPSARTFPEMIDALGHGLLGLVAPRNRFTRRYRLLDWDHRESACVDWVSGACFLVRRAAWDDVGGFDPAYFMYLEDVDLCWRLTRAGWSIRYEPAAAVVHAQGASTGRRPYRMLAAHHRSMWRFAWRTTEGGRRLALPVVAVGLAGRLGVAFLDYRLGSVRARQSTRIP